MNEINEVLTPAMQQIQKEAIAKMAKEQHERAKHYNQQIVKGQKTDHAWAAVTSAFSFGPNGGSCTVWITYHDGKKLYFYGKETTSRGFPVAMAGLPLPAVLVLPYDKLCDAPGTYYASGVWTIGGMSITSNGNQVSPLPWPATGGGVGEWNTQGVGTFKPA